jgi:enolase
LTTPYYLRKEELIHMSYREQLTEVVAEENDIQKETGFYYTDNVNSVINDIENEVNDILETMEDYDQWTIDNLMNNLENIYVKLKDLSKNLY